MAWLLHLDQGTNRLTDPSTTEFLQWTVNSGELTDPFTGDFFRAATSVTYLDIMDDFVYPSMGNGTEMSNLSNTSTHEKMPDCIDPSV